MPGVCHWGPIVALSIITTVTISSTYSALQLWSLPPSVVYYFRGTQFVLMYFWLGPIFWNFFKAVYTPSHAPLCWRPAVPSDEQYLQWCGVCQGYKPPRAHHCKTCGRCVTKMDHHCPWINSCVGQANQASFIWFLIFVPPGCIHGTVVNANFIYRLLNYSFYYHTTAYPVNMGWLLFVVAGVSLGIGTSIGVGILLLVQLKSVLCNRTQIEDWIIEKAVHRRKGEPQLEPFQFPYSLGWRRNLGQVFSGECDGLVWPVQEGAFQYALTQEQLEQKKLKRRQAVTCRVLKPYNGSGYNLTFGLCTLFCTPRCQDPRMAVSTGQTVSVTRWTKYWVYGDLIEKGAPAGASGWVPRACVLSLDKPKHN